LSLASVKSRFIFTLWFTFLFPAHPDSPGKKGSFNVCVCVYFEQFDGRVCRIRSQGSAAINMCTVASGRADAFWEFGIHAWDIAAGDLIVREAGGVALSTDCM